MNQVYRIYYAKREFDYCDVPAHSAAHAIQQMKSYLNHKLRTPGTLKMIEKHHELNEHYNAAIDPKYGMPLIEGEIEGLTPELIEFINDSHNEFDNDFAEGILAIIPFEEDSALVKIERTLKDIESHYDAYEKELAVAEAEGEDGMLDISVLTQIADYTPFVLDTIRKQQNEIIKLRKQMNAR